MTGNRRIGIHKLSTRLAISYGSAHHILHRDLAIKKLAAKSVPHKLTAGDKRRHVDFCTNFVSVYGTSPAGLDWIMTTDEAWFYVLDPLSKVENMHWMTKEEQRPQAVRREMSTKKLMFIPFFDRKGIVHYEFFANQTVSKEVFDPLLDQVLNSVHTRRGVQVFRQLDRYQLHMDNAPAHRSYLVQGSLRQWGWSLMKHPPYSPDLSPADFFLFPLLKRKLRGKDFKDINTLAAAIVHEIGQISSDQWKKCFQMWINRCRKCLVFQGRYFEGMDPNLRPI